jgi:hypothetical protein
MELSLKPLVIVAGRLAGEQKQRPHVSRHA